MHPTFPIHQFSAYFGKSELHCGQVFNGTTCCIKNSQQKQQDVWIFSNRVNVSGRERCLFSFFICINNS